MGRTDVSGTSVEGNDAKKVEDSQRLHHELRGSFGEIKAKFGIHRSRGIQNEDNVLRRYVQRKMK